MNDEQQPQPSLEKPATPQPADPAAAAGAMLRQAREAAGVHLAALAVSLKVPPARLEALEAGRIDLLPDPVFARALAASICRSLKLDPEPVLKQLPRTTSLAAARAAAEADGRQLTSQAARPASAAGGGSLSTKPFMIAAVVLVLAALALVFVPELNWNRFSGDAPAASGAQPGARPGESIEKPAATAAAPTAAPAVSAPPPIALAPATPAAAPSVAGSAEPAPAAAAAPAERTAAAPAPAEAPAGDTIVFRTQSEAWISVIDAKGTPLLRKNVPAGQTVGVSGAPPLRVTVGRADVTKVSVRGEPLDLAPLTKGSIARFEVK